MQLKILRLLEQRCSKDMTELFEYRTVDAVAGDALAQYNLLPPLYQRRYCRYGGELSAQ